MVEVLIAVAVLAIASLGVMGVLTYGVVAGDSAGDFSAATQYGRELIENIRMDNTNLNCFPPAAGLVSADDDAREALNAPPFDKPEMNVPGDTKFKRNIEILAWPNSGDAITADTELVRIRVRVYWGSPGQAGNHTGERMSETVALLRNS
jgi:hypothetical protein